MSGLRLACNPQSFRERHSLGGWLRAACCTEMGWTVSCRPQTGISSTITLALVPEARFSPSMIDVQLYISAVGERDWFLLHHEILETPL